VPIRSRMRSPGPEPVVAREPDEGAVVPASVLGRETTARFGSLLTVTTTSPWLTWAPATGVDTPGEITFTS